MKVGYFITTKTADNATDNHIRIRLLGEKSGSWSSWINLQGHHEEEQEERFEYTLDDLGPIKKIQVYVKNEVPFLDHWKPHWIRVEHPHDPGVSGTKFTMSHFAIGERIESLGMEWLAKEYSSPTITNRPPITVDKVGTVIPNTKTVEVAHFHPNETSRVITVMKQKEMWTEVNEIAISTSTTSSTSTTVVAGYEYDSKVAGTVKTELQQAWGQALENVRKESTSKEFSREQDWSYEVGPHSYKFRKLILNVPSEYTLYASSDGSEKRYIRKPGGPVTDSGTGDLLEIPQKDRSGNIIPILWDRIKNDFLPYMDSTNVAAMNKVKAKWFKEGWVKTFNSMDVLYGTYKLKDLDTFFFFNPLDEGDYFRKGEEEFTIRPAGKDVELKTRSGKSWRFQASESNSLLLIRDNKPFSLGDEKRIHMLNIETENGKVKSIVQSIRSGRAVFAKIRDFRPSSITIDSLKGSYQRFPTQNRLHSGSIQLNGQGLKWVSSAGVSWTLNPSETDGLLKTDGSNPFQESGPRDFILARDSFGQVQGFHFGADFYKKV